jgi:transcriptional regulator with XRE-family HTH domain
MEVFSPDRLWAVMVKKKVNPLDLIEAEDFEPRTLGEWLTGLSSPRPSNLRRLARALGTTEQAFMATQEQKAQAS